MNILVIDDHEDFLSTTCALLKMWGHTTSSARTGAEALAKLKVHAPELILLDWILPDSSGSDVLDAIHQDPNLAATPIIVLSGHQHLAEQPSRLSGVRFLLKPVATEDLQRAIHDVSRQPPLEVLIADDMDEASKTLVFTLRHYGIAVRHCHRSNDCADVFARHRNTIDVVVVHDQETMSSLEKLDSGLKALLVTKTISPIALVREIVAKSNR